MPKEMRIALTVLFVLVLGGGTWYYLTHNAPAPTGTLTLYGNVDIREVQPAFNASGHITAILVQQGARVKKGQILATIEDTRYAATLAQAKAAAVAARVTHQNDELNYRRYASLARTSAASKQQRDNAKPLLDVAQASYDAAVAAVALAQRNFDDTRLYAPSDSMIEQSDSATR